MSQLTPQARQIAETLWKFHNDQLADPSIKEMKPYIDPILDMIDQIVQANTRA